jgi:predicted nuclease of predicted toxin-antitoxin system
VKLLLDHNISHKLVTRLADIFPDSTQTRVLNFGRTNDPQLWLFAKTHNYVFVTKDRDVAELAILRGAPPKIMAPHGHLPKRR